MTPDDVPIWELIRDLGSIKLSDSGRKLVKRAAEVGMLALSHSEVVAIRELARRNKSKLIELYDSRQRARHSVAKVKLDVEDVDYRKSGFGF